jgi:DNA primase
MEQTPKPSRYLYDFVKKKVDLSDFLETEIGCKLNWYDQGVSAGTICPLPHHKDNKPSFRIKLMEEDGVWVYHCLGCGAKGTIIDFFMEYYGIHTSAEAILRICTKFGFKDSTELAISCLKDVKKRANFQKKIEFTHIVTSNQCRMLLRKNFSKYHKWVASVYRRMNDALENEDIEIVEAVGSEASRKMQEI